MRVRVVGENQDESKWPLYRRRTRQGCYDSRRATRLSPPRGARWEPLDSFGYLESKKSLM
jgi:hypothetical protein